MLNFLERKKVICCFPVLLSSLLLISNCSKSDKEQSDKTKSGSKKTNKKKKIDTVKLQKKKVTKQDAHKVVEYLLAKEYDKYADKFDERMKLALDAKKLESLWKKILIKSGQPNKINKIEKKDFGKYVLFQVETLFEKQNSLIKITYNLQGQISGLYIAPLADNDFKYTSPKYANPGKIAAKKMKLGLEDWKLDGILTCPAKGKDFPVVILIHGSGPNDKDETIGKNKPFRDLAEGLASRGICIYRYEKRTKQYQNKYMKKLELIKRITIKDEIMDDALAIAAHFKNEDKINPAKIYLLGHSLGAYIMPKLLKKSDSIAGAIMLAGSVRPLEELYLDQVTYLAKLDGKIDQKEKARIKKVKKQVELVKNGKFDKNTSREDLPLGSFPDYFLYLKDYKPLKIISEIEIPILILQGGRDYQVTAKDEFVHWQKLAKTKKNITTQLFPALNHLFIAGKGKSNPEEYQKEGHISAKVITTIHEFIIPPSKDK
ncbi:MAG: DUF3887 domain-containing protein [Deltaproteobacteria bacterium]|jgi:dienelactone hydrolase|nr:DUF3887 domain-containing protein [Deltaproteobacteria bacterium]